MTIRDVRPEDKGVYRWVSLHLNMVLCFNCLGVTLTMEQNNSSKRSSSIQNILSPPMMNAESSCYKSFIKELLKQIIEKSVKVFCTL